MVYPLGRHHVEDGFSAAGAGGSGPSPRTAPDSAGVGHHSNMDGGAGCSAGPRPCTDCDWREEPALCQRQTDPALGGGTLQEEEAV